MFKKSVLIFLTISLCLSGFFLPLKAKAILGVADIAINPEGVVGWITDVTFKSLEFTLKAALEALRKRLFDEITDNIIEWIQGGYEGKPKFAENFGETVQNAANAAVGDFVEEIGAEEICRPFKARLQVNLTPPPRFGEAVRCTLDQIVGNFEDFYNDFETGGWIAYGESLKPENNYFGVLINAFEEANVRAEKTEEVKKNEIISAQGFDNIKRCDEWTLTAKRINGEDATEQYSVTDSFSFPNPNSPPPNNHEFVHTSYTNVRWKCSKTRVTTPGATIAKGLERSLYSDLDYLISSQELSAYVGAILDAAINRLIQDGVEGIQNLSRHGETPPGDCSSLQSQGARDACNEYSSTRQVAQDVAQNARSQLYEQQAELAYQTEIDLKSTLQNAIQKNSELASKTQELITCQSGWNLNCVQNPDLSAINQRGTELNGSLAGLETIREQINQLRNDLTNPETPEFERRAKQALLEGLTNRLNETLRQSQVILEQIERELERVQNELDECRNPQNGSYSCPT